MRWYLLAGLIVIIGLGMFTFGRGNGNNTPVPTPAPSPTSLPVECKDPADWETDPPIIFSLSQSSGTSESELEIKGCNFNGFEGDLNAWIENSQGIKGILRGQPGSTPRLLKVKLEDKLCQKDNSYSGLPCTEWLELRPGEYKIYVEMLKKSNEMKFEIRP